MHTYCTYEECIDSDNFWFCQTVFLGFSFIKKKLFACVYKVKRTKCIVCNRLFLVFCWIFKRRKVEICLHLKVKFLWDRSRVNFVNFLLTKKIVWFKKKIFLQLKLCLVVFWSFFYLRGFVFQNKKANHDEIYADCAN